MTNGVYYKKTFCIGRENVPEKGTPVLIASNHQNALNDALGFLLTINDRKVHFIVRASVFLLGKAADRYLRLLGLLPAFRMDHEGLNAVSNNGATFRDSEKALADGKTVVIFPEAGHQWIHWLGKFSYGYTKMAFDAAEMTGFTKDIKILPACNHYSKYFDFKTSLLIRYGTPISLEPYYELYKVKPRTAQREVNKLVREQISSMMLNIEDVDNYEAIDYIRTSEFGDKLAAGRGAGKDDLPARLESDKKLVADLAQADIIMRATSYISGDLWQSVTSPVLSCAWLFGYPYVDGKVNHTITGLGHGMRRRKVYPAGRMIISIPYTKLSEVIEALGQMDWELLALKEDEESKAEMRRRMDAWQDMSPDFILKK